MINYRFQNIDKDLTNAITQKNILLQNNKDIIKQHNESNIMIDKNITNQNIDKIYSNIRQIQKIEDKIKELKEKSSIPDPNSMTLDQFISALLLDTYDMFNELLLINEYSISDINKIVDKNYRKIIIYILLIIIIIIIYYMLSIKSYLFSDVRNN